MDDHSEAALNVWLAAIYVGAVMFYFDFALLITVSVGDAPRMERFDYSEDA